MDWDGDKIMENRMKRNFNDRSSVEQELLLKNTFCSKCNTADLGMHDPVEYEVSGKIYLEGKCNKCDEVVKSSVTE
jgi:RNase P subunit RPR2